MAGAATGDGADTVVLAQPVPTSGAVVEVLGSTHGDTLLGTEGPDQLIGKGGGDRIEGRGGDDFVVNDWDEYAPARGEDADDVFIGGRATTTSTPPAAPTSSSAPRRRRLCARRAAPRPSTAVPAATGSRSTSVAGGTRSPVAPDVTRCCWRCSTPARSPVGSSTHGRERFVVRFGHRDPVRSVVADVERVVMPHNRGRWTYLGTPGDDRGWGADSHRPGAAAATTCWSGRTPTTCCSAAPATTSPAAVAAPTGAGPRTPALRAASLRTGVPEKFCDGNSAPAAHV